LEIRAKVSNAARFDAKQRAILFDGHFILADLIATMDGRGSIFTAGFIHLTGAPKRIARWLQRLLRRKG